MQFAAAMAEHEVDYAVRCCHFVGEEFQEVILDTLPSQFNLSPSLQLGHEVEQLVDFGHVLDVKDQ